MKPTLDEKAIQTQYRLIEALQESEARYKRLVNSLKEVVFQTDMQGRWNFLNDSWTELTGYDVEDCIGNNFLDYVFPDDYQYNRELFQALIAGDESDFRYDVRYKHRDGGFRWVEVYASLVHDDAGQAVMRSGTLTDITERKASEIERERLLSILDNSSDFIGMLDANGGLIYVNAAGRSMVGLSADDNVSQMTLADFHPRAEIERFHSLILPQVNQLGSYRSEVVFAHRDGQEIPALASFGMQKNRDGSIESYSVIAHDLRAEKEQQRRIEHIQRLESMGVLAGGIAHDFNNILTAILGNAALAERKNKVDPQSTQRYLNNIVESSEKAAELCKQMLAYSGKGKFVVKSVNLSEMVEEIVKLLEVSIGKGVALRFRLADHLPLIEADASQMQQIIMNFVINASDAIAGKNGIISIDTGVIEVDRAYLDSTFVYDELIDGSYVFLEVSDTGCGMDKATQERLFEPFFTTKEKGHGLGMSAVIGIVRGHQGAIKVYSEPGEGTTIKVMFPASQQNEGIAIAEPCTAELPRYSGSVLIIDDEESVREVAALMLEDMGFDTLCAVDGLDGVEVYRQHQQSIVAVLLDMTMPRLDGKGCFRELRRINPDVQVVLCSGYNEQEATSRFTGKGLASFVQKPYRPEVLMEAIHAAIAAVKVG
ncbi:PAS domain S-box protein [Mariprofundus ferrooxydans]|nr:PAS domain S-box protein [Mariprofundus ferrooxydans]